MWHHLDLRDAPQPEAVLAGLPRLPGRLRSLVRAASLQFATALQDRHLQPLRALRLRRLELNACHRWAGEAATPVICLPQRTCCWRCPAPRRHACRLTGPGIAALLSKQPGLASLSLYWSPAVSDVTLLAACATCTGLTRLSLSGCSAITGDGVRTLGGTLTALQALDLTRRASLSRTCGRHRLQG